MEAKKENVDAPCFATKIASDFPFLKEARQVEGKPVNFLDSAASSQKPSIVLERMEAFARSSYANVHRGIYHLANIATKGYESGREKVRQFLDAEKTHEIIFTKNATEAINLIAYSFLAPQIQPGDEIMLSTMEHHSNIVPWHFLRERYGAVLTWIPVTKEGLLATSDVEARISKRTKLIAMTHMSNVLGTRTPLEEVITLAHAHNIPVLVDGAQGAVYDPISMQSTGVDFYVCTGHKLYGPTGIGVLYGKEEHLHRMQPFLGGGEMIANVGKEAVTYASLPHKFEAGTPPIIEAFGLGCALDYLKGLGTQNIQTHKAALVRHALQRLSSLNFLDLYGLPLEKSFTKEGRLCRSPVFSFSMKGVSAADVAMFLDQKNIAIRAGHHCAKPLMDSLGAPSVARISCGLYTTLADIDDVCDSLQEAQCFFHR